MGCISPLYIRPNVVPCGRCNNCRKQRMLDWAFRLKIEMRYCVNAYFVTLTLRFAPQSGVSKRHLQLYFKRLRKANEKRHNYTKIVYYAVAEYGERTLRPHYHAIIFNAHPDTITESWKLGRVHLGCVSDKSIAYVANYSFKGSRCPRGQRKPFSLMSRRPAIGAQYLETHKAWHRNDQAFNESNDVSVFKTYTSVNGVRGHLPRFYRDKIFGKIERQRLNLLAIENADARHRKQIDSLLAKGYTESQAFNYILENAVWHNNNILNLITQNESI